MTGNDFMLYLKQFYADIKNSRSKGYAKIFYTARNHFIYQPKIIPEVCMQYLKQFYADIKNSRSKGCFIKNSLNYSLFGKR